MGKKTRQEIEEKRTRRAARLNNALLGTGGGAFLGGQLHGGASGYKGARVGALLGGLYGLTRDPRRRDQVDALQTASFETPARRLIEFGAKFRYSKTGDMLWKSQAATISPETFLKKALPFSANTGPHMPAVEKYRQAIRNGEKIDMPQLWVKRVSKKNAPSSFRVTGHEGRHRMIAAQMEGVKKVPVEVTAYGEARYPKRSAQLKGAMKRVDGFAPEVNFSMNDGDERKHQNLRTGAAVAAGTAGVGTAAYTVNELRKMRKKYEPQKVVAAGLDEVQARVGKTVGKVTDDYFPTFKKIGSKVLGGMRRKVFSTPANALHEFKLNDEQRRLRNVAVVGGVGLLAAGLLARRMPSGAAATAGISPVDAIARNAVARAEGNAVVMNQRKLKSVLLKKERAWGGVTRPLGDVSKVPGEALGEYQTALKRSNTDKFFNPKNVKVSAKNREWRKQNRQQAQEIRQKHKFATPAVGMKFFSGRREQLRDKRDNTFAPPLKVAAGFAEGYYKKDAQGRPVVVDITPMHAQVIKAGMRKAHTINKWGTRAGRIGRDSIDVVKGKERRKDASGRTQPREWEKSWFKNGVKNAAITAGLLGGAYHLRNNPRSRQWVAKKIQGAQGVVNRVFPDAMDFETPASRVIEFGGMEKRFKKIVTNEETGRTKTVRYGQAGKAKDGKDRIRPGTAKGDAYCARSAKIKGDWRSDPNSPNNLSRRKWKCSGSVSEKNFITPASRVIEFARGDVLRPYAKQALEGGFFPLKGYKIGIPPRGSVNAKKAAKWLKAEKVKVNALAKFKENIVGDSPFFNFVSRKKFSTPASQLIHFDDAAHSAGWDVRDPRGRSARVFAPGSGKRERRDKYWYERSENERKLWKAAVVASGVAGLVGGRYLKRAVGKAVKAPVPGYGYATPAQAAGVIVPLKVDRN